ncbi:MAG TPA: rhomboid family intramembrane serine protease [Candidatus Deferrimicrobium sp.]|nr:rhomboid family intramembrane serine protease [Candidatus Deferrimicrobium sp.]
MIIPIGHENQEVYKLPWVTFFIMAACLIVHIATGQLENKGNIILQEMFEYFAQHPYLQLDPEVKKILLPNQAEGGDAPQGLIELYGKINNEQVDEETRAEQQAELNRMAEEFKELPSRKWGLIPSHKTLTGFFGYMFLHSGWLHLIGNLFLFYLCGPFIEDRWGKIIYTPFYLLSGIFSAFMFSVHYPAFNGSLIGASGAVSGMMGAFLITNWKTKIHFIYFLSFWARGTFSAPAWLMLPIWVLIEFFNARVMDSINAGEGGGGVAHWAHVWGFVFGVLIAAGMKYLRIEDKYITPKIQAESTYVNTSYARYEEAMELRNIGKVDEAYVKLKEAIQMDGVDTEVMDAFWNVSLGVGKTNEAAPYFARYIQKETINRQLDAAWFHYQRLKENFPEGTISNQSLLTLMEYLIERGEKKEAGKLAGEILQTINIHAPAGLLLQFSDLTLRFNPTLAERVIALSEGHPDIPESKRMGLKVKLAAAKADMPDEAAQATPAAPGQVAPVSHAANGGLELEANRLAGVTGTPAVPNVGPSHPVSQVTQMAQPLQSVPNPLTPPPIPQPPSVNINITVTPIVPMEIKNTIMKVNVDKVGARALPLNKIKAISSAYITSQGEPKFLLIDLFLDDPAYLPANNTLRTVRILSLHFNPRSFFPEINNLVEAYRKFIGDILQSGNARPHPDLDSVQLIKIKAFPTIKAYEEALLNF